MTGSETCYSFEDDDPRLSMARTGPADLRTPGSRRPEPHRVESHHFLDLVAVLAPRAPRVSDGPATEGELADAIVHALDVTTGDIVW